MAKNESIGFIGLGMMGKPMAENLLAAGYRLRVFNRSSDKAASLAESGATVVSAPEDAAETGGIVMSCVADDAALEAVVGRSGELAERLGKGGVHVSMSTVLPETAVQADAGIEGYSPDYPDRRRQRHTDALCKCAKRPFFVCNGPRPLRPGLDRHCGRSSG